MTNTQLPIAKQITPRTLTEMQNYPTAYEVSVGGQVVAYTAQKTKKALLRIAQLNGEAILANFPDEEDIPASYSKAAGWTFGHIAVKFTGRTEREAASVLSLV